MNNIILEDDTSDDEYCETYFIPLKNVCADCGGPTGWLHITKDNWRHARKELRDCETCGYYMFCSYCDLDDINLINYGYYDKNPPKKIKYNEKLIHIKLTYC
jgi:hypothetical protein